MPKARFDEDPQLVLPLEYLTSASDDSLRTFRLRQLNHAANIEKEMKAMQRERDKASIMAEVAQVLIENRTALLRHVGDHLERAKGAKSDAA